VSAVAVRHRLDGPPGAPLLILSSSLGTSGELWRPQLAALAGARRVLRYDHRGHGGSPVPLGPYRIADLGRDLLALLDVVGVARADVAGLSLGGMVAMWVAAHAPDRVRRLALLCTSANFGPPEPWLERAATVRAAGTAAVADAVVARWFTPAFREREPGTVAWARNMLIDTPAEGYAACCEAIAGLELAPELDRITAPTLVVAGADDPAAPPDAAQSVAAGIAGSRLEVVDGVHLLNVERPAAVTRCSPTS